MSRSPRRLRRPIARAVITARRAWARQASDDEIEAFQRCYDETVDVGYGVAVAVVGEHDAADVVESVYRDVWSRSARAGPAPLPNAAEVAGMVHFRAVSHVRASRTDVVSWWAPTARGSCSSRGSGTLESLGGTQRTVLTLTYVVGLTCQDVAALLGLEIDETARVLRSALLRVAGVDPAAGHISTVLSSGEGRSCRRS